MSADPANLEIVERPDGIELTVKVVPGASRTEIAGLWDTALRVTVAAPPEAGKANTAVVKLLANSLGVKRADVQIVAGQAHALKRIGVSGLTPQEVRSILARLLRRMPER